MKNLIIAMICILLCISCDKKPEAGLRENLEYATKPVGEEKNGDLILGDIESIKYKWNEALNEGKDPDALPVLKDFKIAKALTIGEQQKEYYLLMASTTDGKASVGCALKQEKNKFYLDVKTLRRQSFTQIVMCRNSCAEGACIPAVVVRGDEITLICGICSDCEKTITEIYLAN